MSETAEKEYKKGAKLPFFVGDISRACLKLSERLQNTAVALEASFANSPSF